MSLTRAQWEDMWEIVKKIEANAKTLKTPITRQRILNNVERIKSLIQLVIGQME